jgi:AcrR family transcriptional regulator
MAVEQVRRRQEERTAMSDQSMIAAAIKLIVEQGVAGTTLAAIGERAGYSRGLVTHRFGSKAGLLAHVHDALAAQWIARVQASVGAAVGAEALERAVDALYGFIAHQPDDIRALYLLRYISIDPGAEYRANVAKVHKAQRRDVQGWIEKGQKAGVVARSVNAEQVAELLCATVDGLIYRWLINPAIPVRALHERLRKEVAMLLGQTANDQSKGKM